MTKSTPHPLTPMIDKLRHWGRLTPADEAAVLALPFKLHRLRSGTLVTSEGESPQRTCVLLSGYAIRHKLTGAGARQIFSIHMRGDVVDLHNSLLRWSDHNVQALNDIEVAFIPLAAIERLIDESPNIARLLWYETLVDGSIFREWTLNVGRRDGRTRMAHMLCEFALRLKMTGLGERENYELPMTQDELADVLALTPVHVSRVLKLLTEEKCIAKTRRVIRIQNWARLMQIGDFDPRYLHYQRMNGEDRQQPMSHSSAVAGSAHSILGSS